MRKQYHFRTSDRGLLAWDVEHLIQATASLTAVAQPLCDIRELDEAYWYDMDGDRPTCKSIAGHMRLVEAADLSYPIILCPAGRVMDGMHRVLKAFLAGRSHVLAYRLQALPDPDFVGVEPDDLPYGETDKPSWLARYGGVSQWR